VKHAGFKPRVIEWGCCGWWKWWISGGRQYDRGRKRWVRDSETWVKLMERSRKLIPETRWSIPKGTILWPQTSVYCLNSAHWYWQTLLKVTL